MRTTLSGEVAGGDTNEQVCALLLASCHHHQYCFWPWLLITTIHHFYCQLACHSVANEMLVLTLPHLSSL